MLKVVLVDDEALALRHMEKLLGDIGGITIIGKFQNPYQALEFSNRELPDVIFLDIEMPGFTGIELAERVQNAAPKVKIVFVTAYDEYAVKAFELNAIDYVVKPVQRKRLTETVKRLRDKANIHDTTPIQAGMVCCFHTLHFKKGDTEERIDVRWRTSKARELFSFLIHNRNRPVRKDIILELLWPELDYKKGYAQLYAAIYQIRKTLDSASMNIIISSLDQSYTLELNDVRLDLDEWERGMQELPLEIDDNLQKYQKTLELYQGDYFAEEGYLWAESERERYRTLWLQSINILADTFISKEMYIEAILLYQRVQVLNPFIDNSYFELMKLYSILGEHLAVEQQYCKLLEMLEAEFDVGPNKTIEEWYQKWLWKTKSKQ